MSKSKIIYSFDASKRYKEFCNQLRKRGVQIQTVWQARKDGKASNSLRNEYPDVECLLLIGASIQKIIIVTLHTGSHVAPADVGFDIFFPSPNNEYAKDIETILGKTE